MPRSYAGFVAPGRYGPRVLVAPQDDSTLRPARRKPFTGIDCKCNLTGSSPRTEAILASGKSSASTCGAASTQMGIAALRDHADGILSMIAADLATAQNAAEQSEKSKGRAVDDSPGRATAAEEHGAGRAESGFTLTQMVAEYRALRASVIRLWTESRGGALAPGDIEQLTRFNEAIDQSLAESVVRYSEQVERAEEISLAIMGHDLRTGLAAIRASATALLETQHLDGPAVTLASQIAETADRSTRAVGILLDFSRTRLGEGIPITRAEASMDTLVRNVAAWIAVRIPSASAWRLARGYELLGRVANQPALTNLMENAVRHGTAGMPITVQWM